MTSCTHSRLISVIKKSLKNFKIFFGKICRLRQFFSSDWFLVRFQANTNSMNDANWTKLEKKGSISIYFRKEVISSLMAENISPGNET